MRFIRVTSFYGRSHEVLINADLINQIGPGTADGGTYIIMGKEGSITVKEPPEVITRRIKEAENI